MEKIIRILSMLQKADAVTWQDLLLDLANAVKAAFLNLQKSKSASQ